VKTLNRQLKEALRPIKQELRQPPRRNLVARVREIEADTEVWMAFRSTVVPLKRR